MVVGVVGSVDVLPYQGRRLLGLAAGDEMVDRSFLAERLRPLGLWWVATGSWVPRPLREPAGSWVGRIVDVWAWSERVTGSVVIGASAAGPSSRRTW